MVANVTPRQGIEQLDSRAISFYASEDGHYYIEADVEGTAILFLVDTGASDVVLTKADAERLRYEPDHLDYTKLYNTANGTVGTYRARRDRDRVDLCAECCRVGK